MAQGQEALLLPSLPTKKVTFQRNSKFISILLRKKKKKKKERKKEKENKKGELGRASWICIRVEKKSKQSFT